MQEPCRSCDRRGIDFGGCRCQALLLAGDAAATDAVCALSPVRHKVDAVLAEVANSASSAFADSPLLQHAWLYRVNPS
jgi:pyrroloquinoline quinone biosynthesis protein E